MTSSPSVLRLQVWPASVCCPSVNDDEGAGQGRIRPTVWICASSCSLLAREAGCMSSGHAHSTQAWPCPPAALLFGPTVTRCSAALEVDGQPPASWYQKQVCPPCYVSPEASPALVLVCLPGSCPLEHAFCLSPTAASFHHNHPTTAQTNPLAALLSPRWSSEPTLSMRCSGDADSCCSCYRGDSQCCQ